MIIYENFVASLLEAKIAKDKERASGSGAGAGLAQSKASDDGTATESEAGQDGDASSAPSASLELGCLSSWQDEREGLERHVVPVQCCGTLSPRAQPPA